VTVFALVNGSLFRDPETKISKAGKPYVIATIVSKEGGESTFVNLVAFSDSAKEAILALGEGDALSAQGKTTIGVYEKNGEHRPSLSIVADRVLALRQPPRERKTKTPGETPTYRGGATAFDDSIPFGCAP
jgi:single-stranded DNA-binding protein